MKPHILLLMMFLAACTNPYYSGPKSDHYNGQKFYNPGHPQPHTFGAVIKWRLFDQEPRPAWPEKVELPPTPLPATRVEGKALTVTPLGHATVLIQTGGLNILTDPLLIGRASPFSFMGPQRVTPLPFPLKNLPRIDAILISHNHYDHLSLPTLKALYERDHPRIIVPLGNDTILKSKNIPSEAHDWNDTVALSPSVKVTLHPVQHWSARTPWDRNRALWGGYTLQTPAGNIFFAGDTGYGNGWWSKPLGQTHGPYKLVMLPIGAYAPRWFMAYSHLNPAEAVQTGIDLKAENILPIHWGTFHLTNEAREDPPAGLQKALENSPYTSNTAPLLLPGQPWHLAGPSS